MVRGLGSAADVPRFRAFDEFSASKGENIFSEADVVSHIRRVCFTAASTARIGVEVEMLVGDAGPRPLDRSHSREFLLELFEFLQSDGLDGRLTMEPGGQIELSSCPTGDLSELVRTVHRDLALLHGRATQRGASLVGFGADPVRDPRQISQASRYTAMAEYFRPWDPAGRDMMCATASLQINVDSGSAEAEMVDRWRLLHGIGPTLVAAFANSAWRRGRNTGWKSARLASWLALDPSRTGVPPVGLGESLSDAYARWALDAPVMLIRRACGGWAAPPALTFRDWMLGRGPAVDDRDRPTADDLDRHLTTLFPHVRPKGFYEIRYLDAQPECWWVVPVVVVAALVADRSTAARAEAACAAVSPSWRDAARFGLDDPVRGAAAIELLALAAERLRADPSTESLAACVEGYLERWTIRGAAPADDPPHVKGAHVRGCVADVSETCGGDGPS